jgi:hypothetical protein
MVSCVGFDLLGGGAIWTPRESKIVDRPAMHFRDDVIRLREVNRLVYLAYKVGWHGLNRGVFQERAGTACHQH